MTLELEGGERKLIAQAQSGNSDAKAQLLQMYSKLIKSITRRFYAVADEEELFQVGCLGLLKAIAGFDSKHGTKLSTYAVPVILGEIKAFLRSQDNRPLTRNDRKQIQFIKNCQDKLYQQLHREPSIAELSEATGIEPAELVDKVDQASGLIPIDKGLRDEQELNVHDAKAELEFEERLEKLSLSQTLSQLSRREQLVITLKFFEDKTQAEIANRLHLSQPQISRLQKRVLLKLKELLEPRVE